LSLYGADMTQTTSPSPPLWNGRFKGGIAGPGGSRGRYPGDRESLAIRRRSCAPPCGLRSRMARSCRAGALCFTRRRTRLAWNGHTGGICPEPDALWPWVSAARDVMHSATAYSPRGASQARRPCHRKTPSFANLHNASRTQGDSPTMIYYHIDQDGSASTGRVADGRHNPVRVRTSHGRPRSSGRSSCRQAIHSTRMPPPRVSNP